MNASTKAANRWPIAWLFASAAAVAGAVALYAPPVHSQDGPRMHMQGKATWVSGGVGEDEATAMKHMAADYPLELLFAERDENGHSAYLAAVKVEIRDASGKTVLGTQSEGPFLLVRLPPGRYAVVAEKEGAEPIKRNAEVAAGKHQRLVFEWR